MTAVRPLRVNAGEVPPNRRRGGDIRVTLSPATVGATSGFGGVLKMLPGESVTEHRTPRSSCTSWPASWTSLWTVR
jgi:putative monooxygenase